MAIPKNGRDFPSLCKNNYGKLKLKGMMLIISFLKNELGAEILKYSKEDTV